MYVLVESDVILTQKLVLGNFSPTLTILFKHSRKHEGYENSYYKTSLTYLSLVLLQTKKILSLP
jgi:hypothetical protein